MINFHGPAHARGVPTEMEPVREFFGPIFGGNEGVDEASARLHARLDYALSLLFGLQQPSHPESDLEAELDEADRAADEQRIREVAEDLLAALDVVY